MTRPAKFIARAGADLFFLYIAASVSVTPVAFAFFFLFSLGWKMKTYDQTDDIIAALIFLGVGVLTGPCIGGISNQGRPQW
jgi:uncharacterized protein YebE (UPF0316 family)